MAIERDLGHRRHVPEFCREGGQLQQGLEARGDRGQSLIHLLEQVLEIVSGAAWDVIRFPARKSLPLGRGGSASSMWCC